MQPAFACTIGCSGSALAVVGERGLTTPAGLPLGLQRRQAALQPPVAAEGFAAGGSRLGTSSTSSRLPLALAATFVVAASSSRGRRSPGGRHATGGGSGDGAVTERPLVDQLITGGVKAVEAAEMARVKSMSETPSSSNDGWSGEPREWADSDSLTQKISSVSQSGPFADFKQFLAEKLAGDYDQEAIGALIDSKIASEKVMMFSFSSCPFCLRAKSILREKYGANISVYECDLEPEGKAVRAELGRRTGRTSMPSTWLGPDVLLGGCNDGGLGGVATLDESGQLREMLEQRGAVEGPPWWATLFGGGSNNAEVSKLKQNLLAKCAEGPKNGVGASEDLKGAVEGAASALEPFCGGSPTQKRLTGSVWNLVYCTAPGGSSGRVGAFVGDVTQTFVDDTKFVNAVELFGALRVALEAEREVIDDRSIKVSFREMTVSLFGNEVLRKPAKGSGVWKQRFVDDDLRVMNTPSLFVLRRGV
eukprot:TRINITY_DN45115_c0_g1_i1.p1 TRINITY_DN45115_c0_g1~~TRINITY_DN45115_c0_g1_i1.p1  ORF type:complete len:477 (+),score=101.64 TRINITY_DN45115_c0_g1_i1:67-1497(+)